MLIYEITRRCMQRFITAGVVLYALGMLVLVGLWTLVPQLHALVAFTNIFALYFFLPLVVVLPLALAQRSQALRAMAAVLVVLFGVLFGPRMLPVLARPAGEPTLRVITFNQFIDNQDIAGSVAVLTAQQADIVALQELSPEMAAALSRLEAQYPYQWLEPQPVPGGLGILSRYPLTYAGRLEGVRGQWAQLTVQGQSVTLINVHPPAPIGNTAIRLPFIGMHLPSFYADGRNQQLEHLLAWLRTTNDRLIVAGDFNTADREHWYQQFDSLLRDAYAEGHGGLGHTFPNSHRWWLPRVRIDYIWTSDDMLPLAAQVNCTAWGSDHCMVMADLAMPVQASSVPE